jgi:hypothetical protein
MDLRGLTTRIRHWVINCFGASVYYSRQERAKRFLEETLELNQALEVTKADALKLVERVYSRPVGMAYQELGGVGVTLLALCDTCDLDFDEETQRELRRVEQKSPLHFRKRHAIKAAAGVAMALTGTEG